MQEAYEGPRHRRIDEVEDAVPAGQQLRESIQRLASGVGRSVPLRTVLFLLPPLVLPPLAFDLSPGAAIVVALLLLWLAGAAGVLATLMFEGSDHLALRAIERRIDQLPAGGTSQVDDALIAVGAQLDKLGDRVDELSQQVAAGASAPGQVHRPPEHWSTRQDAAHYDRESAAAAAQRHWSDPRWQP